MYFISKKIIDSSSASEIKDKILSSILDGVESPILLLNKDAKIIFANRNFLEFVEFSFDDVLDEDYIALLPSNINLLPCTYDSLYPSSDNQISLSEQGRNFFAFDAAITDQKEKFCYSLYLLQPIGVASENLAEKKRRFKTFCTQSMLRFVSSFELSELDDLLHQHRVGRLAIAIAKKMGLSEDIFDALYFSAIVMNSGELFVPSEIMQSPNQLSDIEFSYVKTHPEVGYNLLRDIQFIWPLPEIVLQHHERIDGSGYPRGLQNDDILIEAKILGVADTIEAMSSDRPYRNAFEIETILKVVKRLGGVKLDPRIVAAALELFQRDQYQFCDLNRLKGLSADSKVTSLHAG